MQVEIKIMPNGEALTLCKLESFFFRFAVFPSSPQIPPIPEPRLRHARPPPPHNPPPQSIWNPPPHRRRLQRAPYLRQNHRIAEIEVAVVLKIAVTPQRRCAGVTECWATLTSLKSRPTHPIGIAAFV